MVNRFFKEDKLAELYQKYGKDYKENDIIFREDDTAESFYIIYRGKIKIMLEGTVLNTLGDGELFGELALIDKKNRSSTAIAIGDSKILEFKMNMFKSLLNDNQVVMQMLKTMIARISRLSDMSAKLLVRKERTRILVSLTNLVKSVMSAGASEVTFNTVKAVKMISKDTRLDENVVEKYLKEMEVSNKIKIKDDKIIINNVVLLRKIDSGKIMTDWLI